MKYQVIVPKKVQKDWQGIDKLVRIRVSKALLSLNENPYLGKKLEGKMTGQYSIRVWPYRIIYDINNKQLIILIIRIAHR